MWSGKLVTFLLLMVLLAACTEDDPPPTPLSTGNVISATATAPVIVTRVITLTPVPTITPSPSPTVDFSLAGVEGTWTLLMRHEISDNTELGTVIYSASGSVNIDFDGNVSGEATFSPTITFRDCPVAPLYEEPLTYTISGTLRRLPADAFTVHLTLTPADPAVAEGYRISCFESGAAAATEREVNLPLLQRTLEAGNLLTFSFDLDPAGIRRTDERDLSILTGGAITGTLKSEVYLGR